jgi:general stress protein 26
MNATPRLPLQGGAIYLPQFIDFVRQRDLAVIATRGADGAPQAALVGIAATWRAELAFDTSRSSRKYRNLSAFAQVAMVIGWDNEMTVQCEGIADIPMGSDHDRCLDAYLAQYPDGVERAHEPDIVHVRVRPNWLRYSTTGLSPSLSRRPLWATDPGRAPGLPSMYEPLFAMSVTFSLTC